MTNAEHDHQENQESLNEVANDGVIYDHDVDESGQHSDQHNEENNQSGSIDGNYEIDSSSENLEYTDSSQDQNKEEAKEDAEDQSNYEIIEEDQVGFTDPKKPSEDDFESYEDYQDALVDYKVQKALYSHGESERKRKINKEYELAQRQYQSRVESLDIEDYEKKANSVPLLPDGVANALVRHPEGPRIIMHLADNKDLAKEICKMDPAHAMMKIGSIKLEKENNKTKKISSAPNPIETGVVKGSAISAQGIPGVVYDYK